MSGEKETTEPQALVAVETPQDPFERLRKVLDEVQTNQAEHATHLDLLQQNADRQRTNWAADRMRLNALAQEVKELRDNAAEDRLLNRNNAEQVKKWCDTIEAHRVWLRKIEEAIDAVHYRRMVGNLFRRVADAVDGG